MHSFRGIRRYFPAILVIAVLLTCCQKYEGNEHPQNGGTATLFLELSIPDVNVETKSISSDPSDPSGWTTWERAVDGRYLYRVTAFLLQGKRLVSTADMELTEETSKTVLEFEGNFTHGNYTLMVAANYSAHQAEDGSNGVQTYAGLTDFTSTVETILEQNTIEDFTSAYEDSFIKYELASHDGICAKVPQALTMVKDIELHPGVNNIAGELVRTYSRVRITAENQSDEQLMISSLSFSNAFTQRRAYIFPGNGYIQDKVALDVDSPYALTAFTATEGAPLSIDARSSSVIFDAYILESSRVDQNEEYSYTLDLGYDGTRGYKLRNTNAISRRDNVSSGYYIIYSPTSGRYLTSGANSVQTGTLNTLSAGMTIPEEYVWTIASSGQSYRFYIGTSEAMTSGQTAYYISNPSSDYISLGSNRSVYFTVSEEYSNRQYYLNLQSSGNQNRYIAVSGSSAFGQKWNNKGSASRFWLYPVNAPSSASSSFKIPLETIDKTSGQPVLAERIDRNDFVNVVVLVKYNKNKGHFEFEVRNWESAGGDVEFN